MARQWLRDQWFVAPSRCRGTRDILRGRGGNGERETKSCPGRCCADAATDCQKSWGCTEEDGGHISFSSGPHVVITSGPTRTVPPRVHADDRQRWQTSGIHGIPGIARSFASFTPPPAMSSMSSQYLRPPSDVLPIVSAARSRAVSRKLHHPRILLSSRQITAYATAAICGVSLNGRPFFQPYVLVSGTAWREASRRAAFRCALPVVGRKRCHLSTQLRCIFFTAH
jgi:hypothetical protein